MAFKIVIQSPGSFEKLELQNFTPEPLNPREVAVRVHAAGVNFADVCVRMGVYSSAKKYVGWPITPGFEIAGTVETSLSPHFKPGDRVIGITRFGGYTSHINLPDSQLFPLPSSLSFEEGATFAATFLTAYYALFELVHPKKNDTLLIHSAAGGVGVALLQLAHLLECRTVAVVGNQEKVQTLNPYHPAHIIDKSAGALWQEAEAFAPEGYAAIFDPNGRETLKESYRHLASSGKLVVYGFQTMLTKGSGKVNWLKACIDYLLTPRFNPLQMTSDNKSVLAFNLSYLFDKTALFREAIEKLLQLVKEGKIRPCSTTSFPLQRADLAHEALQSGKTTGKLVLVVDSTKE